MFAGGNAQVMNDAALMLRAGFKIDTEPFLKSMLVCLRAHLLHVRHSSCSQSSHPLQYLTKLSEALSGIKRVCRCRLLSDLVFIYSLRLWCQQLQ